MVYIEYNDVEFRFESGIGITITVESEEITGELYLDWDKLTLKEQNEVDKWIYQQSDTKFSSKLSNLCELFSPTCNSSTYRCSCKLLCARALLIQSLKRLLECLKEQSAELENNCHRSIDGFRNVKQGF